MMKWFSYFCLIISVSVIFLLMGCAPQVLTPSPGEIQTALAQTLTAQPSATVPATKAPTRTTPPTSTPFQTSTSTLSPPISGKINADFLNIRTGPSTFFEIINTFVKDTALTAFERTPDNAWVRVEIEIEDEPTLDGWMAVDFLVLDGEASALPVANIDEAQVIRGRVEDTEENAISGIDIAAVLQNDQFDLRADVLSSNTGDFEIYLPENLFGTFDIQIVGWMCESPVVDLNCQFSGYVQVIDRSFITIPQEEQILFIYEATDLVVSGVVVDADDDPVAQMNIRAERDDGAVSFGRTDALGEFTMPISEGTWEIFAVSFDPEFVEGDRVSLDVTQTNPADITLQAPQ